ncbi:MAG: hypothetical protein R2867_24740 [Caldilineaceae bacterium]
MGLCSRFGWIEAALKQHPDVAGIVVVANETSTGVRNQAKELAQMAHARDIPILVDAISGMGGYDLLSGRQVGVGHPLHLLQQSAGNAAGIGLCLGE